MEYIPLLGNVIMAAAVACGIILTLIGLPGNFLILAAAVIYGWQENFLHLTYAWLLVLASLWGGGELMEFIAGISGAKKQQASRWAMLAAGIGSIAGGILGTGILPLLGTLLGALVGGFMASFSIEYIYTRDKERAQKVASGVVKGQLWGMLLKVSVAIGMSVLIIYRLSF
ncbi:MAG: DUF456 domain-containing protein [Pelosinus sp.]|nr:DUF456 domain-containing protein [Pelosinus sp.]